MTSLASHSVHLPYTRTSYTPASKSADISRLLDPSYASSSSSQSQSPRRKYTPQQTKVYVDHNGHLHDPDYRHFPTAAPAHSRSQRAGSPDPFVPAAVYSRPAWELGVVADESALVDSDDEYDEEDTIEPAYPHPIHTNSRRSSSVKRHSPSYGQYATYSSYSSPYASSFTPQSTPLTISSSTSSDDTFVATPSYTPFEDRALLKKKYKSRCHSSKSDRPRTSFDSIAPLSSSSFHAPSIFDEHVHPSSLLDESNKESTQMEREDGDAAPSCTEGLKMQWQGVKLRVQIGAFRMRRRMKGVLAS